MPKKLQRVFIANRGEIARRIAMAARTHGLESVALYGTPTPPDYLQECVTHLVHCPEESTALYLNGARMIAIAKEHGADAIHPGFGFLSENAEFAAAVEKAGLVWIGPPAKAIDAMASKASARELAEAAGVPVLAGLQHIDLEKNKGELARVKAFASKTGYPLLIKAAFGGGGKGMRLVYKDDELEENASRASSEALRSFGNGSIIVEKYLPLPRHVEVQILADSHGTVLSIGDRDCSLQRRHQKILEEAPAPDLEAKVREDMHASARNLAARVGYVSAGTVEFLVIGKGADQKFYFLEMNTRLQVEHPVTEQAYGLDLVSWQFRVAEGETLTLKQADIVPRTHSIEVRLYAEDMGQNFLPMPGPVAAFLPYQCVGVRWEVGLDTIDTITTGFDPMVSKLVVTAPTRPEAMALLAETLRRTVYCGPTSNIPYLVALASQPDFQEHVAHTHYIQDHVAALTAEVKAAREILAPVAEMLKKNWQDGKFARTGHQNTATIEIATHNAFHTIKSHPSLRDYVLGSHACFHTTSGAFRSADILKLTLWIKERAIPAAVAHVEQSGTTWLYVQIAEHTWRWPLSESLEGAKGGHHKAGDAVVSPVPGKVIALKALAGSDLKKDQVIAILESMKMQFEVQAPRDGVLGQWLVKEGDQVDADAVLIKWATST